MSDINDCFILFGRGERCGLCVYVRVIMDEYKFLTWYSVFLLDEGDEEIKLGLLFFSNWSVDYKQLVVGASCLSKKREVSILGTVWWSRYAISLGRVWCRSYLWSFLYWKRKSSSWLFPDYRVGIETICRERDVGSKFLSIGVHRLALPTNRDTDMADQLLFFFTTWYRQLLRHEAESLSICVSFFFIGFF